jgi:hypothetical protein
MNTIIKEGRYGYKMKTNKLKKITALPEQLYDWGGIVLTIAGLLANNDRNFVSAMDRIENRIITDIDRTIEAFEN